MIAREIKLMSSRKSFKIKLQSLSFTFGLEIVIIVQSLMYQKFKSLCQDEFRLVLFRMEKLKKKISDLEIQP